MCRDGASDFSVVFGWSRATIFKMFSVLLGCAFQTELAFVVTFFVYIHWHPWLLTFSVPSLGYLIKKK